MLIPKDPNGSLVDGKPDETIDFDTGDFIHPEAVIQLHQHTDGTWMWSTSVMVEKMSWAYDVGDMWGNFALSRDSALTCAIEEIKKHLVFHKCQASTGGLEWCDGLLGVESKKGHRDADTSAGPLFSGI